MHTLAGSRSHGARPSIVVAIIAAILALGILASPIAAADPSVAPATQASPAASEAPPTMCESLADLRLYVGFLRDQSLGEDGVLPILVGTVASIAEARVLASLAGETYRPLVDDLIAALAGLRSSLADFGDAGTVGSGLVGVGEAIVGIGLRMDALSVALQEPCPSASPAPSPAP